MNEHTFAAPPPAVQWLTVDDESTGQRLDNFLLRHFKGVPKTHVYRLIRSGQVRVNKGRARADSRVQVGDLVRLPPVRTSARAQGKSAAGMVQAACPQTQNAVVSADFAPPREFPVLLEDEHLMAIDKPAGVAVHGGSGLSFGVIEQLRRARPEAKFLELVHRLDRETSGILLIAKKRSALKNLQQQFKTRETGKTYLALVLGDWPARLKVIDQPLHKYLVETGQGQGERRVKVVGKDDPDGMRAITLVKVRQRLPGLAAPGADQADGNTRTSASASAGLTLLEVTIKTGRTHQIRVHLAAQGHPIAGDDKYGQFDTNKALQKAGLKRMFLHAWRLRFAHPDTGAAVELLAELPPELLQF